MTSTSRFYTLSHQQLDGLRQTSDINAAAAALPVASVPSIPDPNFYVAFALAYLRDEGLLRPVDSATSSSFNKRSPHARYELYDPARADLSLLEASRIDGKQVAHEYFAGSIKDQRAVSGLTAAIQAIRQNLAETPHGDLLLVEV